MSNCKQCPHVIGDADERDCAFPDCIGCGVSRKTQSQYQIDGLTIILSIKIMTVQMAGMDSRVMPNPTMTQLIKLSK